MGKLALVCQAWIYMLCKAVVVLPGPRRDHLSTSRYLEPHTTQMKYITAFVRKRIDKK